MYWGFQIKELKLKTLLTYVIYRLSKLDRLFNSIHVRKKNSKFLLALSETCKMCRSNNIFDSKIIPKSFISKNFINELWEIWWSKFESTFRSWWWCNSPHNIEIGHSDRPAGNNVTLIEKISIWWGCKQTYCHLSYRQYSNLMKNKNFFTCITVILNWRQD